MPFARVQLSVSLEDTAKEELAREVSSFIAGTLGKPEKYVMVAIDDNACITFAGSSEGKYAFIDIRSIGGLDREINKELSQGICGILEKGAGIKPDNVYLNFQSLDRVSWGWNSGTF